MQSCGPQLTASRSSELCSSLTRCFLLASCATSMVSAVESALRGMACTFYAKSHSLIRIYSFEDRKACEEVIKAFNNKTVTALGEEYTVQIRYADTQEQKHLKQTTAAARQFRTAEYEFATQTRRGSWLSPASRSSTSSQGDGRLSQDFENYLRSAPV